jgi:hypothetical protein
MTWKVEIDKVSSAVPIEPTQADLLKEAQLERKRLDRIERLARDPNLLNEPTRRPDEIDISPDAISLDLLQAIYRNPDQPLSVRIRCAVAALSHEAPKLIAQAQISEGDFATLLEQRIKRFNEAKVIEAKPQAIEHKVESRPPMPRVADKRFRRI